MNENAPETASAVIVVCSLADFQPLHAAEAKVVAGLGSGDFNRIGNGLCPTGNDPTRIVRAELLRLLILGGGGDFRLHEKGLRLSGAEVIGVLDLEGCRIPRECTAGVRSRARACFPPGPICPGLSLLARTCPANAVAHNLYLTAGDAAYLMVWTARPPACACHAWGLLKLPRFRVSQLLGPTFSRR